MFKTIVVILVLGQGHITLDDSLGPYDTKQECFMRGAEMLHFATTKLPIIWANVGCAERLKKDGQDNKEDTEEEDKAKKVGV